MTASKLIKFLSELPPDAQVFLERNNGTYLKITKANVGYVKTPEIGKHLGSVEFKGNERSAVLR